VPEIRQYEALAAPIIFEELDLDVSIGFELEHGVFELNQLPLVTVSV